YPGLWLGAKRLTSGRRPGHRCWKPGRYVPTAMVMASGTLNVRVHASSITPRSGPTAWIGVGGGIRAVGNQRPRRSATPTGSHRPWPGSKMRILGYRLRRKFWRPDRCVPTDIVMVFSTLNVSENALALEARRVQVRGKRSSRMHSPAHLSSDHPELPSTSYLAETRVNNLQLGNLGTPLLQGATS